MSGRNCSPRRLRSIGTVLAPDLDWCRVSLNFGTKPTNSLNRMRLNWCRGLVEWGGGSSIWQRNSLGGYVTRSSQSAGYQLSNVSFPSWRETLIIQRPSLNTEEMT